MPERFSPRLSFFNQSRFRRFGLTLCLLAAGILAVPAPLLACPFCTAVSQTMTERIAGVDVVVVAEVLDERTPVPPEAKRIEAVNRQFKIKHIVKGMDEITGVDEFVTMADPRWVKGTLVGAMAIEPPNLMWAAQLELTPAAIEHMLKLKSLPADGPERLAFFFPLLEDPDQLVQQDAYNEFAAASYQDVKDARQYLSRKQLLEWIKNPDVTNSHRRLYFTLLATVGEREDAKYLEDLVRQTPEYMRGALDALFAAYLTLGGPDGLPLLEKRFINNPDSSASEINAVVMALRFQGQEENVIPKQRLAQALHPVLNRLSIADLVIADLARWEDWTAMDLVVEIFKRSDEESRFLRVPVIRYLQVCPLPEAEKHLAELQKLDPEAFRRASTLLPIGASRGVGQRPKP